MIYNPLERRRAEEFAQRLDSDGPTLPHSSDTARASGASTETLAELIGVTESLEGLGEQMNAAAKPSADWQNATRRRLMAVAADEGIGATARHRASAAVTAPAKEPVLEEFFPRRPRGGRRIAVVAALLTGTVAVSGVSAASGDALPGETLYNFKRSTERAQLALAGDDLGRAQLHLEFASTRIEEAAELSRDDAAVEALNEAANELREGAVLLGEMAVESGEAAPLDYIDLFTNEHRWTLEELAAGLDGDAADAADELIALIEAAALRSVELRDALDCTEVGGPSDELGPVPGGCAADASGAAPAAQGDTDPAATDPTGDDEDEGDDTDRQPPPTVEPVDEEPVQDLTDDVVEPLNDVVSEPAASEEPGDGESSESGEPDGESDSGLDAVSGIVENLFG